MKVLISGGAGFIGSRVARALLAGGHAVTVLDSFSPQIHGGVEELAGDVRGEVRLVRGDVRDRDAWERALAGQEGVVHLAAETGTGQSMYEVQRYSEVNLSGTALLYDLLAKQGGMGVERVVVASSRAIYGEGAYRCGVHGLVYPRPRSSDEKKLGIYDPACPACGGVCEAVATPEGAPMQPASFYGLTKQMQEQMALLFGGVLGIPTIALRYQNVYGPGQSLSNPYTGILAIFSNLARTGARMPVFEDGRESRDFVYVDDVVRATVASLEREVAGCYSVNVGSGERTTVMQVAQAVNEFFGARSAVAVSGAFREGDIRHGFADLAKAQELLGYRPEVRFEEGLRRFLTWAAESEPQGQGYARSIDELRQRGLLHDGG